MTAMDNPRSLEAHEVPRRTRPGNEGAADAVSSVRRRGARFWDRVAERYSRSPVSDEVSYQKKLAKTRTYFRPDMEVLEVGCGTGSTAIAHAPYVRHIRATDLSPAMIEIARAKATSVSNLDFDVASIEELQIADGTLDMVLALSVLHLVEDDRAAIARVFRMLKPGGVFVTSTPCLRNAAKYVALLALIGPPGRWLGLIPPKIQMFTRDALIATVTGAGFTIDYEWRPAVDKAVFIVAKKPGDELP